MTSLFLLLFGGCLLYIFIAYDTLMKCDIDEEDKTEEEIDSQLFTNLIFPLRMAMFLAAAGAIVAIIEMI
jgi:hypothetical protein